MNHNDEWAIPAQDIQTGDGTEEELNLEQITRTTTRRPMLVHQHEGTECLIPIALYTIPTTVHEGTEFHSAAPTAELLSMTTRPERITIVITVEDNKIDVCQTMMERYADSVEDNKIDVCQTMMERYADSVEDNKIDVCQTMMERYADSVEDNKIDVCQTMMERYADSVEDNKIDVCQTMMERYADSVEDNKIDVCQTMMERYADSVEDNKIDVCQTMMERYADSVEENDCVATVKMVADITERVLGVGDSGSGVMLKIGDFLKMLHPVQARSAGDAIFAAVERMRLDRLPKVPRHV